ncbi:MAG TPA: 2'-5' RNA ligase family protein [Gemmatimonadaceae bacterium]
MQLNGIFIIAELKGEAAEEIKRINQSYDQKLARYKPPHVTIAGSSGAGPIPGSIPSDELRERLMPITTTTQPMVLPFGAPLRFMQSDIIVVPLDPHGPLRIFHDRLVASGLPFGQARFTFSPHCTLSLYPTLSPTAERELLSMRIKAPAVIDRIQVYQALDPQPARKLVELPLTGVASIQRS